MGQWVVQLNGKTSAGAAVTARFAMGPGIAFTDAAYVDGGFLRWQGATQRISVSGPSDRTPTGQTPSAAGVVTSQVDVGEVQIANMPESISAAGPFDGLMSDVWHHSLAQLYWCPDRLWANAVLVSQGQMNQPVANLSTNAGVTSVLRIPLRDPRDQLITQLTVATFLGNNALYTPYGFEGEADQLGKPKPVLYGTASNFPGVLVNRNFWLYMLADSPNVSVLCVRDGGAPLTFGVLRADITALLANTPAAGSYDVANDPTYGTYVRLCTQPLYTITFDASEGATVADRTHAQIWKRISVERAGRSDISGPLIDAASVTATDALDGNEIGFWWANGETCKDAIDAVLASLSAYEVKDIVTRKWSISKLLAPSGTPQLNLVVVTPTSEMKATDRPLIQLDRVQPSYLPDGIPPWKVNILWGQNYTVMASADFAGGAATRLRQKFATQWRTVSDSDPAVAGLYVSYKEMTIPTGYQPGSDFLTCPHAVTEAARIRALYTADRPAYQATFRPELSDVIEAGGVMQLTYPMYDLNAGKLFRVMQAGDLIENGVRTSTVVLGLQT